MNIIQFKIPKRNELLDHVDDLLSQVKLYNRESEGLKVSKVVLAGHVLTPSKIETSLYMQFTHHKGEVFPPVLALDQVLTDKEKSTYLENENKWFERHNFLVSNYVKIKSLAEKEISPFNKGDAKIIFTENMMSSPELKYSINIKKDYWEDKKIDAHLSKISKRPKL